MNSSVQSVKYWVFFVFLFYSNADAVVGGKLTSENAKRSIVNIVFEKTVCSGIVVGPNVVLTAAHCYNKGGAPLIVAYIQKGVKTAECDKQDVVDFAFDPSAKLTSFMVFSPDIMLLKMKEPLCGARVASLSREMLDVGEMVSLAGHSRGGFGHGNSTQLEATLIKSGDVKKHIFVEKNKLAKRSVKKFFENGIDENYLFAIPEEEGSTMCVGDSGGPVYSEKEGSMRIHGVNGLTIVNEKNGVESCGYAYVQTFTPVAPFLDWIQGQISEWE